jgi:hypothetical protein
MEYGRRPPAAQTRYGFHKDGFPYQSFIACVGGEEGVLSDLNLVGGALATVEQTLSLGAFRIFVAV